MARWQQFGILGGLVGVLLSAIAAPVYANGRIIEIRGAGASIQRPGQSRRRADVGTVVQVGDLVFPTNGARVSVQCRNPNGTFSHGSRTRSFGLVDVCPNSVAARYTHDGRGEDDFLLFLEDRFEYASQVSKANPTLRWQPVAGVATYTVELWDCGQETFNCTDMLWQETVEGTTVRYGGTALAPGRNYELVVRAGDGSEPVFSYLAMRRLDAAQIAAVQTAMTEFEISDLSAEAAALAVVERYLAVAEPETLPPQGVGLVLEALAVLEEVAPESATPYVHRLLGDLYLQVGLLEQARMAYGMTLDLTLESPDLASRAAAQVGLANVAVAQGDRAAAVEWLQAARLSYAGLADGERLMRVGEWLAVLFSGV
ncbi:MAG: hypothetical protein AAF773_12725 [Cyanobacteria bacterium P01_D01_bin.115]